MSARRPFGETFALGAGAGFVAICAAAGFGVPRASSHPRLEREAWLWSPHAGAFRAVPLTAPIARPFLHLRKDGLVNAIAERGSAEAQRFDPATERFGPPQPNDDPVVFAVAGVLDRPPPTPEMRVPVIDVGGAMWLACEGGRDTTSVTSLFRDGIWTRGPSIEVEDWANVTHGAVVDGGVLALVSEDSVYTARPDEPRFRRTALDRAATRLRIVGVASAGARILLFFERDGGRTFATLFVDPESGAAQDGPDLPPPVERHGEQELHVARLRDGRALVAQAWTIHSWDRADLPQNIVGCAVAVFSVGGAGVFAFVGKRSVSGLVVGLLVGGAVAGALLAALFSVFSGSFAR